MKEMEESEQKSDWERCVEFHGHFCGGLTIGYKAAQYAIKLLDLKFSEDENIVCICESDSCGVDAIQVMLGCSAGKGNLLFHLCGKHAFSVYERRSGRSVRLVLKPYPHNMSREEAFYNLQSTEPEDLFYVKKTKIELPEYSRNFESYICDCCGEETAANYIRLQNGKKLCLDCYKDYNRFNV